MKNKKILLTILAIALVLGMTACNPDEEVDEDNSGGGEISGNTIASGVTVANPPGIKDEVIEFSLCWSAGYDWPINECLNGSSSVTIKNGKLNMILGVPKDEYMSSSFNYVAYDPNRKFFVIFDFYTVDGKYGLSCDNIEDRELAYLVYADDDVNLKETSTYYGGNNMYLKKGWNYCFGDRESSTKLPNGYQWTVYKMGY